MQAIQQIDTWEHCVGWQTISVGHAHLLDRLISGGGQNAVDIAAQAHQLPRLIVDVRGHAPRRPAGVVKHDVRIWQGTPLALMAATIYDHLPAL